MGLKEKKENRENNKKSTRKKLTFKSIVGNINGKHMRNGSYSMVMTVIFVAVIIVINMIVGELPSKYTQFDVSSSKLYTISDETKEMLHDLDKDVTIYQIAQSGSEDENISQLLGRYEDESKHMYNWILQREVDEVKRPVQRFSITSENGKIKSIEWGSIVID